MSDCTYYRWRKEYGGMRVEQTKRLKELEQENSRLNRLGVKTLFIEPGSPWENGYIESFNGKLEDELLNREIFYTLTEAILTTVII